MNFSQAQVDASASFSMSAYLCSVSDIKRNAKATGLQESSFFASERPKSIRGCVSTDFCPCLRVVKCENCGLGQLFIDFGEYLVLCWVPDPC